MPLLKRVWLTPLNVCKVYACKEDVKANAAGIFTVLKARKNLIQPTALRSDSNYEERLCYVRNMINEVS